MMAWSFPAIQIFRIHGRYVNWQAKKFLLVWSNSLKTSGFPLWESFWENFWCEVFQIADFSVPLRYFAKIEVFLCLLLTELSGWAWQEKISDCVCTLQWLQLTHAVASVPKPLSGHLSLPLAVAMLIPCGIWAVQTTGKPTCLCQCTQSIHIFPFQKVLDPKSFSKAVCEKQTSMSTGCVADKAWGKLKFLLGWWSGLPFPSTTPCARHGQVKRSQETRQSQKNLLMVLSFCQMKNKAHFRCSFEGKKKWMFLAAANDSNFKLTWFLLWRRCIFCS